MTGHAASAAWLLAHEFRLQRRRQQVMRNAWLSALLLLAFLAVGIWILVSIRQEPLPSESLVPAATMATAFLSLLFLSNALVAGSRLVAADNDLPLLMTAPVPMRLILTTKLLGIVAALILAYGLPVTMLVLPFALSVQPGLLGAIIMLPFVALGASALALWLITFLYPKVGGARTRQYANIAAAAIVGLFFCSFLLLHEAGDIDAGKVLQSLSSPVFDLVLLPGRAAGGDLWACLVLATVSVAAGFGATAAARRVFAHGVEQFGGETASPSAAKFWPKPSATKPFGALMIKDLLVLLRDPELLFKLGLRVVYVAPLAFVVLEDRGDDAFVFVAAIAFVLGQLASSIGWLLQSAEEFPDLLARAPARRRFLTGSKLIVSIVPSVLLALVTGVVLLAWYPIAALCVVVTTLVVALAAGLLEAVLAKPSSREMFVQNKDLNFANVLLTMLTCAGLAGLGAWLGRGLAAALG